MRNQNALLILAGVSLSLIGGSIVHLRSGSDAGEEIFVPQEVPSVAHGRMESSDGDLSLRDEAQSRGDAIPAPVIHRGQGEERTPVRTASIPLVLPVAASANIERRQPSVAPAPFQHEEVIEPKTPRQRAAQDPVFHGSALRLPSVANVVQVDPSLPGNALTANGQRVAVDGYVSSDDSSELELAVVIDPEASSDAADLLEGAAGTKKKTDRVTAGGGGLTYEEELFRTKWGWAAFNRIQQVARESLEGVQ